MRALYNSFVRHMSGWGYSRKVISREWAKIKHGLRLGHSTGEMADATAAFWADNNLWEWKGVNR